MRGIVLNSTFTFIFISIFTSYVSIAIRTDPLFCGAHSSWTMAYFLLKLSRDAGSGSSTRAAAAAASGALAARMAALEEKFQSAVSAMTTQTNPHDFHCPLYLAEVINSTTDNSPLSNSSVCRPAKIVMDNCHAPGLIVTSYWPHAAAAAPAGSKVTRSRSAEQIESSRRLVMEGLSKFMTEVEWRDDFMLTTHWVPQFLFLALWLATDRP
jgi:hypothetical protein